MTSSLQPDDHQNPRLRPDKNSHSRKITRNASLAGNRVGEKPAKTQEPSHPTAPNTKKRPTGAPKNQSKNQSGTHSKQNQKNATGSALPANKPRATSETRENWSKQGNSKLPARLSGQEKNKNLGQFSDTQANKQLSQQPKQRPNQRENQRPNQFPEQLPNQLDGLFTLPGSLKFNQITVELKALEGQLHASLRPKPAHFKNLPYDIAALSSMLTEERIQLSRPYWSEARYLAAYLWYFLPWNLVRLIPLLANLPLNITSGYKILDLGSGPLTFPLALWLARPDLRDTPIHFICTDTHTPPMQSGKLIFTTIAGQNTPWHIELRKADVKDALGQFKQKKRAEGNTLIPSTTCNNSEPATVNLITACNVFNELKRPRDVSMPLFLKNIMQGIHAAMHIGTSQTKLTTEQQKELGQNSLQNNTPVKESPPSLLIVEPGNRLGGKIISMLRHAGLEMGLTPASPCPHNGPCPMLQLPATNPSNKENSFKERQATWQVGGQANTLRTWCHFVQNSPPVPEWLQNISKAAGLFKTHTALSFVLLTVKNEQESDAKCEPISGRIISNPFAVPDQPGLCRYACTNKGLALLPNVKNIPSGALLPLASDSMTVDSKSGATIMHPLKDKKEHKRNSQQVKPFQQGHEKNKPMRKDTKLSKKTSE